MTDAPDDPEAEAVDDDARHGDHAGGGESAVDEVVDPIELADDHKYLSNGSGTLPPIGTSKLGDVDLPAGRLVFADPAYGPGEPDHGPAEPDHGPIPLAWVTDDVVTDAPDLWLALRDLYPRTGLWPLVLDMLWGSDERPWFSGELDPSIYSPAELFDAGEVLAACWAASVPDPGDDPDAATALRPFADFPGLASAPRIPPPDPSMPVRPQQDPVEIVVRGLHGRIGLVPAARPADAVAALGWQGPGRRFIDIGAFTSVLRSWESRLRAVPVSLGFDSMVVATRQPPLTDDEAIAVAAEHFAVCPDLIWQETGTIGAYARRIRGRKAWTFWWS